MKKALITGITGQDGSYLAELLLSKGYEVHGIIRRASTFNTGRLDGLYEDPHVYGVRLFLHYGDMTDSTNLIKLLTQVQPDEIYHLAAQTHVRVSFDVPEYTGDVTAMGTIRLLEAIRAVRPDDSNSIRLAVRRCLAWSREYPSVKQRRSIRAAPTLPPSSTPTG